MSMEATGAIWDDVVRNGQRTLNDGGKSVQGLVDFVSGAFGTVVRAGETVAEVAAIPFVAPVEAAADGIGYLGTQAIRAATADRDAAEQRQLTTLTNEVNALRQGHTGAPATGDTSQVSATGTDAQHAGEPYKVVKGDSLWKIATNDYKRHHNGQADNRGVLAEVNALRSQTHGDMLLPGMTITLPKS